jgi:hypothetical protein
VLGDSLTNQNAYVSGDKIKKKISISVVVASADSLALFPFICKWRKVENCLQEEG